MNQITNPPRLPERPISGHKGLFGRVLVIGGSETMIGAPVLAGMAALVCGSGLVQIAVPRRILAAALSIAPELIGLPLGQKIDKELAQGIEAADAVVIGPGMGQSASAAALLKRIIGIDKPLVVDADALNLLAREKRWPRSFKAHAVLTPHPGEMTRLARLIGQANTPEDDEGRLKMALAAAGAFDQVVVLKGHRTVVAAPDERAYINTTGNSALSKAGSGDVLSGMLGSFLGAGMERFDAACCAVHLHGMAGEIAGRKLGLRSVLARDVIAAIPLAIGEFEKCC